MTFSSTFDLCHFLSEIKIASDLLRMRKTFTLPLFSLQPHLVSNIWDLYNANGHLLSNLLDFLFHVHPIGFSVWHSVFHTNYQRETERERLPQSKSMPLLPNLTPSRKECQSAICPKLYKQYCSTIKSLFGMSKASYQFFYLKIAIWFLFTHLLVHLTLWEVCWS